MTPFGPAEDIEISIPALREEGDAKRPDGRYEIKKFLSTPSARRATPEVRGQKGPRNISIHALREEGDVPVNIYGFM